MFIVHKKSKGSIKKIGRKAWNLFVLKGCFSVPAFFVVDTGGYDAYQRSKIFPRELERELRKALSDLLEKGPVAIRSSGTAEDLPGISFAGMYHTGLNITNAEDAVKEIIKVWDSALSEKVQRYCEAMEITTGRMAVIVQHQLKPTTSGVMVTQSPFSVSEILIECCSGLGETLVSGRITPTRYRIRGEEIKTTGAGLLDKKTIRQLARTGKAIERLFRAPQDIEWAVEKDRIYILQARPILLGAVPVRRPTTVWSNVNVRETMPEPISPLWWSLFDDLVFSILIKKVFGFPLNRSQYEKYRPVEMLSGRLYWNVNNMIAYGKPIGPILDLVEGTRSMDPQLASAFKAVDLSNLPKIMSGFNMLWFTAISFTRLGYYILLSFFRYGFIYKKITTSYQRFESIYETSEISDDLERGIENTRTWLNTVMDQFARRYFGGVFLSILYNVLLARLLRIRMGKTGEKIARQAVLGILDKTGEMVLALNKMAILARARIPRVTVPGLKRLYKTDRDFSFLFNKFLKDFGHRGPAEFDLANPNWREDHSLVYQLIYAARDCDEYSSDRKTTIAAMITSSRPIERFILKTILPRIEVFTPLRENGKHIYLKVAARMKDQLFLIARVLITRGFLKNKRDIFFLSLNDLDKVAQRRIPKREIRKLIKIRKAQWQLYRRTPSPDIIYSSGERITAQTPGSAILIGEPLSFGRVRARARIINNFSDNCRLRSGEILVTHHADPGWTPLFSIASGVIIEVGGVICHAAMVARELGVPAVVVKNATKIIPDGAVIGLDADAGRVLLSK